MEDISKLNDYLSIIEIESIINDFLKYYDDKILSKKKGNHSLPYSSTA